MSITTYAELKTAIGNWLARDDLTAYTGDFIALAEARLNRELNTLAQESTADLTISSATVSVPADFIMARRLYLDTNPKGRVDFMAPEHFYEMNAGSEVGQPIAYTIEGTNLVFAPSPDATYTGKLLYKAKFAALSDSNTTNWLLTNAPDLYLYASLMEAEPFIQNDERLPIWSNMLGNGIAKLNRQEQDARFSGSPLIMRGQSAP